MKTEALSRSNGARAQPDFDQLCCTLATPSFLIVNMLVLSKHLGACLSNLPVGSV